MNKPAEDVPNVRERRNRGLRRSLTSGVLLRGVASLAPLLLLPLMLEGLGPELFGVWATMTAITSMLAFGDLGLGSGLLTQLSRAFGADDWRLGRRLVSDSYAGVSVAAVLGVLLATGIVAAVDVGRLLGLDSEPDAWGLRVFVLVIVCVFLVGMPFSLIGRVQFAVQRGLQSNAWTAAASLVAIPIVWVLVSLDASPLAIAFGSVVGTLAIPALNNLVFFASGIGARLRPNWTLCSWPGIRGLLGLGATFAVLSVLTSISMNVDNLLIASTVGVSEVVVFVPGARLFASTLLLVTVVGLPLWAAMGEALSRSDLVWIRKAVRYSVFGLVASTAVVGLLLTVFREQIIHVWLSVPLETPLALYVGFAVWGVIVAASSPFFMVQNAGRVLKPQLVGWGLFLAATIPAKIVAVTNWGIEVVPWVGVVCYGVTVLPAALFGYVWTMRAHTDAGVVVPPLESQ